MENQVPGVKNPVNRNTTTDIGTMKYPCDTCKNIGRWRDNTNGRRICGSCGARGRCGAIITMLDGSTKRCPLGVKTSSGTLANSGVHCAGHVSSNRGELAFHSSKSVTFYSLIKKLCPKAWQKLFGKTMVTPALMARMKLSVHPFVGSMIAVEMAMAAEVGWQHK